MEQKASYSCWLGSQSVGMTFRSMAKYRCKFEIHPNMPMRQINKDTVHVHVPRGLSFSSDPVPGASTQSASTWQHIIMKFALGHSDETR